MIIGEDREREGSRPRPLRNWPAVVCTGCADIDLFPAALANVCNEHIAQSAIEARTPRVPQAERPDFSEGSWHPDEGVIGRDREPSAAARNVKAKDLAKIV